jgi:hypothetical protein
MVAFTQRRSYYRIVPRNESISELAKHFKTARV